MRGKDDKREEYKTKERENRRKGKEKIKVKLKKQKGVNGSNREVEKAMRKKIRQTQGKETQYRNRRDESKVNEAKGN